VQTVAPFVANGYCQVNRCNAAKPAAGAESQPMPRFKCAHQNPVTADALSFIETPKLHDCATFRNHIRRVINADFGIVSQ
jgi:hypothetical protein